MSLALLAVVLSAAFLQVGSAYDVIMTNKGLKYGIWAEGNSLIVKMFGPKPSPVQSWIGAGIWNSMVQIPTLLTLLGLPVMVWAGVGGCVAFGIKHIIGGLQWRTLMNAQDALKK